MNRILIVIAVLILVSPAFAQKYITKNGYIKFYSETPVETIEAHNRQVNSALDSQSGDFVFKVLMKSFAFEKALMQEHFNENYVESHKFPSASFIGKISNIQDVKFTQNGKYNVTVEGDLTIHGVTKSIMENGVIEVAGDRVTGVSKFILKPADFDIRIPKTVINNIAEEIEVTVEVKLEKYKG
ncbi:MAG: YceI family protein [Bacteroidales bacterium]|nr:YceI family protein [Bacteroidales bacterium]